MSLRFSVLASGSTGNAIYVESEKKRLLIDAGLSGKKIEASLKQIEVDPKTLDALLISHEHSDHIKGAGIMARRYALPIYANGPTWKAMEGHLGDLSSEQCFTFSTESTMTIGDIDIESFGVSHDAAEPMFFNVHHEGQKLSVVTDLGYVSERIKGTVRGADTFIFEANHDMEMLRMGKYPWNVKRRILGDLGHISNEDAGLALGDLIGEKETNVYLAHLSKDNNMKDLAHMTVKQTMESLGFLVGDGLHLYDTDPVQPTALASV
ncbi:MBL fold metallo-hydrolase [Texcoconibacillus texcoconensis]|uniref:Phosphoribosyl 1,2-cyclic phosphodiesterase n=1 Tax=Texcoconibacillus texcoconensis TaxID=1095777 RepID=A0A840QTA1_9BACI|nr:MBL fold metallo-hydrolase [Texcoconibacillus texcoconensis]MBB5174752.1 phosphoribosyl 1,2-cyclic phosphodiesterase [Texcoconibacillus texcoconensis]